MRPAHIQRAGRCSTPRAGISRVRLTLSLRTTTSTVCSGSRDLCFARDAALAEPSLGQLSERQPCPDVAALTACRGL